MTNEVAECLAKVGSEMRVELSRCEVRRPPFHSTGVVCLSVEAFIGVLCEAIRSTNGNPLQNELVELGKNLMWERRGSNSSSIDEAGRNAGGQTGLDDPPALWLMW